MDETTGQPSATDDRSKALGVGLLAAGGLGAALGAASCCALPVVLATLGFSGAWIAGIGAAAAPWQRWLLGLAVLSLAISVPLLMRRTSCTPRSLCARPTFRGLVASCLLAEGVLIGLTLAYD